jgi:hypothetical protein
MAVMARLSGIPARVAVGFTRGKEGLDGTWQVTTHDAHAWPELWFQGFGWLPFEPTPRADGQAVPPPYAQTSKNGSGDTHQRIKNSGGQSKVKQPSVLRDGQHQRPSLGGSAGNTNRHSGGSSGSNWLALAVWALLIIAGVGLLVPGTVRAVVRHRRWLQLDDPARGSAAAWAEMRDSAVDLGAPWDDDRSPRQVAATLLAAVDPDKRTREAMMRLVRCEERSRYSSTPEPSGVDTKEAVLAVRRAIAAKCRGRQRTRAIVFPRSTLLAAQAQLAGLARRWHRMRPGWLRIRSANAARRRVVVRA